MYQLTAYTFCHCTQSFSINALDVQPKIMLCTSVFFPDFTQLLEDSWNLLFTLLLHKKKKKKDKPNNLFSPQNAQNMVIVSSLRRKWLLLCLNKQQCSSEEVQEPPMCIWRFALATSGSGHMTGTILSYCW